MSELPARPNLDQLRRQARELLRAAQGGERQALDRLRPVSDRVTLSAAQLAVAREYGFPSWPALHAEIERQRLSASTATARPDGHFAARPAPLMPVLRSLGGTATIDTRAGTLSVSALIIGPDQAFIDGRLMPSAHTERQLAGPPREHIPGLRFITGMLRRGQVHERFPAFDYVAFDDVTVADDQGATYSLRMEQMTVPRARPGRVRGPIWLRMIVSPVPPARCSWIDLRGPGGPAARLLPSSRPDVGISDAGPAAGTAADREIASQAISLISLRLAAADDADGEAILAESCSAALNQLRSTGQLDTSAELGGQLARLTEVLAGRLPAGELPASWTSMLNGAQAADGPSRQLDLMAYVPAPDGIGLQLDTLVSEPGSWQVYLRATPGWWIISQDNQRRREPLSVLAEDDQGGTYASSFGGGTGRGDHDELALRFRPRLNPRARTITLTFAGHGEQVTARIALATIQEPETR